MRLFPFHSFMAINIDVEKEFEALLSKAALKVPLSDPGKYFYEQAVRAMDLFMYLINLSEMADNAASAYWDIFGKDDGQIDKKSDQQPQSPYKNYLREQSPVFIEMIFCRLVDNFLSYISEIIRLILQKRPELLKSSATIQIDYVLNFSNFDELIQDLIDRKVIELGYIGFLKLNEWCEKRIGETITNDQKNLLNIIELIERRNIIVHNRSRVGKKYLEHVKNCSYELNEHQTPGVYYLFRAYGLLVNLVKDFDPKVARKFSIQVS